MTTTAQISEKARAILAVDNELQGVNSDIFDIEARLLVLKAKRQALTETMLKIYHAEVNDV